MRRDRERHEMTHLQRTCNEVIESGKKATKRPWVYDVGNSEIEQKDTRCVVCPINISYRHGLEPGEFNAIDPFYDGEYITIAANRAETLASALLVMEKAMQNYCEANMCGNRCRCCICEALVKVEEMLK